MQVVFSSEGVVLITCTLLSLNGNRIELDVAGKLSSCPSAEPLKTKYPLQLEADGNQTNMSIGSFSSSALPFLSSCA